MKSAGDKLVINVGKGPQGGSGKGTRTGPVTTVRFGSASVPIYRSQSRGRVRYTLSCSRDGKRLRQVFTSLEIRWSPFLSSRLSFREESRGGVFIR